RRAAHHRAHGGRHQRGPGHAGQGGGGGHSRLAGHAGGHGGRDDRIGGGRRLGRPRGPEETRTHGFTRGTGERAPGADRSRRDGLQGRAGLLQGRPRGGGGVPAQEGTGGCGQEGAPGGQGRGGARLYPPRRQARRPAGGQLRDRLRGAHRGLPAAREGPRHAGGGGQPLLRIAGRGAGTGDREGARDLSRPDGGPEEAAAGARQDHRGQAGQVLRRAVPARAAVRPGRHRPHPDQGHGGPGHVEDGRARGGKAFFAVQGGRGRVVPPAYRRVLLKIAGEALAGSRGYGIDPETIARIADEIREVVDLGVQLAVVIGGGNIFRGIAASAGGMERATGDYMGMLATVIN